jgi:hypothetical protein
LAKTFHNLRKFKMKLNTEKCTFSVPSEKLLRNITKEKRHSFLNFIMFFGVDVHILKHVTQFKN